MLVQNESKFIIHEVLTDLSVTHLYKTSTPTRKTEEMLGTFEHKVDY